MARDPYLVAIDIGSNSIKLAVVKESYDEVERLQVLALVEQPSSGIKRGVVTNMNEATDSLVETINKAETIIGLPIKRGVFGINGLGISFINSGGLAVISNQEGEIGEDDLDRVIQDSLSKAFGINNNEILHVIPKNYRIDNQSNIRYPVGMIGSKLEAETLVISVEPSYLRNFTKVINQSEVDILDRIYTPLASGDYLLGSRQKKAGSILIDLGHASTSFIVWENEEIFASGIVPIGSDHITSDLAVGLQTTIEMADEIKKQYLSFEESSEVEEVEMYNPDLQINEIFKMSEIKTYARARVEEIFAYINKELRKVGKNGQLAGGVVLTGGGASLKGVDQVAKSVLRLPIFRHNFDPNKVEFVPDYNNDPTFHNCIALAAYFMHHEDEVSYSTNNSRSKAGNSNSGNSVGGFLKNIWPFNR